MNKLLDNTSAVVKTELLSSTTTTKISKQGKGWERPNHAILSPKPSFHEATTLAGRRTSKLSAIVGKVTRNGGSKIIRFIDQRNKENDGNEVSRQYVAPPLCVSDFSIQSEFMAITYSLSDGLGSPCIGRLQKDLESVSFQDKDALHLTFNSRHNTRLYLPWKDQRSTRTHRTKLIRYCNRNLLHQNSRVEQKLPWHRPANKKFSHYNWPYLHFVNFSRLFFKTE